MAPPERAHEASKMVVGTTIPRSVTGLQPEGVLRFDSSAEASKWLKDNGLEGRKLVRELPNGESALFFSKQQMKDQLGFKPGVGLAASGIFSPRSRGVDARKSAPFDHKAGAASASSSGDPKPEYPSPIRM